MAAAAPALCIHADAVSCVTRLLAGDRTPLRMQAAELANDERSRAIVDGGKEAELFRLQLVDATRDMQVVEEHYTPGPEPESGIGPAELGRSKVDAVQMGNGEIVLFDGRELREDWRADPQTLARALALCGSAWGVHQAADGEWGEHRLGCKTTLCPCCSRTKARQKSEHVLPVALELLQHGYQLAHLTLTQRVGDLVAPEVGHVVTGYGRGHVGLVGAAVWGEPLRVAIERLRASWLALRDHQAHRRWFKRYVAGFVSGIEWTGKCPRTGRRRWHVHMHVLLILKPHVERIEDGGRHLAAVPVLDRRGQAVTRFRGPWFDELCRRWCSVSPGALPDGQELTPIEADNAEAELREVLKYPFKPASLTPAQIAEVYACAKGLQTHAVGGCLHAASHVGDAARALAGEWTSYERVLDQLGWEQAELARAVAAGLTRRDEERVPVSIGMRLRRMSALVEPMAGRRRRSGSPYGEWTGHLRPEAGVERVRVTSPASWELRPDLQISGSGGQAWQTASLPGDLEEAERRRVVRVEPDEPSRHGAVEDDEGREWVPLYVRDLADMISEGVEAFDLCTWSIQDARLTPSRRVTPFELLQRLAKWTPPAVGEA